MDLEDLLDEKELKQDEWSLTAPRFGEDNQLQVVGWSGKRSDGKDKFYISKCNRCGKDNDLFGEGYFRSLKTSILAGQVPCGCSKSIKWSKDQYIVLCSRKAEELGYTFIGFEGEWLASRTKVKMFCEKHGEWRSGSINNLVSSGNGCVGCGFDKSLAAARQVNMKSNETMIKSFFASGAFHPDTKFWRSDRKTGDGKRSYWYISCPECGETGESQAGNLQLGSRCCGCGMHRQKEAYINLVLGKDARPLAIKFGITSNSKQRIKQQISKSIYPLTQHSVYIFTTIDSCKKAERQCLQELECGVVLQSDMKDGYTETTWVYNLDKIVEIYERNGGVRVD